MDILFYLLRDPIWQNFAVVLATLATAAGLYRQFRDSAQSAKRARERVDEAESKLEAEPAKARPAWDLARATLDAYFSRNLSQINSIFIISIIVMVLGFLVIVWGVWNGIQSPSTFAPALLASAAGIITEFIGATFLFLYRSTLQQANVYLATLERINSVGMAMQILDTMPEGATADDLKSKTKASLINSLMRQSSEKPEIIDTVPPK